MVPIKSFVMLESPYSLFCAIENIAPANAELRAHEEKMRQLCCVLAASIVCSMDGAWDAC